MSPLKVLVVVAFCAAATGSARGSVLAGVGDMPHHAGVYSVSSNVLTGGDIYTFECSAAVVGGNVVVTTAKCARSASKEHKVAVSAGMLLRLDKNNVFLNVSELIEHEDFDPETKANNVALLKLVTSFEESSNLSSIPLRDDHITAGSLCSVSGWRTDFFTVANGLRRSNTTVLQCPTSVEGGAVCLEVPEDEPLDCLVGDEGSPIVCGGFLTGLLQDPAATCLSWGEAWTSSDVSVHAAWIRDKMAAPPGITTTPKPSTTTTRRPTTPTTARPGSVYESKVAVTGDVPYQAAVWSMHDNPLTGGFRYDFECAGSVLSEQFVLTTATCSESVSGPLAVSAGFVSRNDPSVQHLNVTEIIKHADFDSRTRKHDIALLRITPGFTTSSNLSVIPLGESTVAPGSLCRISGWQADLFTVGNGLKFGNASVLDCEDDQQGGAGVICAGFPKAEYYRCLLGDEGGPIACDGRLTGVLNYNSMSCTLFPDPGTYTDVAFYREWIAEKMSPSSSTTVGTSDATTTVGNTDPTQDGGSTTVGTSDATTTVANTDPTQDGGSTTTVGSSDPTTTEQDGGSTPVGSSEPTTTEQDGGSTTGVLKPGGGGASSLTLSVASITVLICASIFNNY